MGIIIWKGKGIFALIIMLAAFAIPLICAVSLYDAYPRYISIASIPFSWMIGGTISGLLCWYFGRKWNRNATPDQYHTLYFIRVEYWGIPCFIIALFMTVCLEVVSNDFTASS
jgi:hypothetical protein